MNGNNFNRAGPALKRINDSRRKKKHLLPFHNFNKCTNSNSLSLNKSANQQRCSTKSSLHYIASWGVVVLMINNKI